MGSPTSRGRVGRSDDGVVVGGTSVAIVLSLLLVSSVAISFAQENEVRGRGFSAEKVYDIGRIDAVNLFNGNLTITIRIGQSYPVNAGLSYGLTLVNNAKVTDHHAIIPP